MARVAFGFVRWSRAAVPPAPRASPTRVRTMTPPPTSRAAKARGLLPYAVVAVGVVASVTSATYLRQVQSRDTRERFSHRAI